MTSLTNNELRIIYHCPDIPPEARRVLADILEGYEWWARAGVASFVDFLNEDGLIARWVLEGGGYSRVLSFRSEESTTPLKRGITIWRP